jgi:nitrogen PTS system EIIA component
MPAVDIKISTYLDERNILFLDEKSRDDVLSKMVESLFISGKIKDKDEFYKAVLEREKIISTGIGMGIAIPHAKKTFYEDFFIAVGVQYPKGIEWNSLDSSLVRLILMIGGPEDRQNDYLQILSKLTDVIKEEKDRMSIIQAKSAEEILNIFKEH